MRTRNKDNKKNSRTGGKLSSKTVERVRKAYEKEFDRHKRVAK